MIRPFEYEPLPDPAVRQHFVTESAQPLLVGLSAMIPRFRDLEMVHRADLFVHYRRVAVMTKNLWPIIDPSMPRERQVKLFRMAYHHDDPEYGTGDIPSDIKMGLTLEQKKILADAEGDWLKSIADLLLHFMNPEDKELYLKEQEEIHNKSTPDSQFLDIVDKLDGLGETMHELYSGNRTFLKPLENYRKRFQTFEDYPAWDIMRKDPAIQLTNFPDESIFPEKPIMTPNYVKSLETLWELPRTEGLHPWYRSWLGITIQEFDRGRAKFLFPGWPQVWQRPEEPPIRTTLKGIQLANF